MKLFVTGATGFIGYDAIVHLAASGVLAQNTPISTLIKDNVLEPLELFTTAIDAGVTSFMAAGTCFEYGRSGDQFEFLTTDTPLAPTNPYAASKAAAAVAFESFAKQNRCCFILARIFHAYGDGEAAGKFWPSLKEAALAGRDFHMSAGDQIRDFIPVRDVATQLLSLVEAGNSDSVNWRIDHIASGRAQTLRTFAIEKWQQLGGTGRIQIGSIPYRPDEVMRYVSSPKTN